MPAGTTIITVKRALLDRLDSQPGLDGVLTSYGDPGAQGRKELISVGDVRVGEQSPVNLRATPSRREENYELEVTVAVIGKATNEKNETRCVELVHEIEEVVSNDPTLGGVPGLLFVVVSEMSLRTDQTGDGPVTTAIVTLDVKARMLS